MTAWSEADIPDQRGRVAVITGANTGIGFETARALAEHGATVVLACRNLDKAKAAAKRIAGSAPSATVDVVRLDLASLTSVRAGADEISTRHEHLDLLVNNAGVTGLSGHTQDGFEIQFGINHLGHYALTGLLLDRLLGVPGSRVVTISSIAHRFGRIDTDDPQAGGGAYARSKLANLLFTHELQRRLQIAGSPTAAVAAHPGGASTEVFRYSSPWFRVSNLMIARLLGQTPAMGALPTLRAATDPDAQGGDYYGPAGLFETSGYPERVRANARSRDAGLQQRLWQASEQLTKITYPV